jgi:hypothetical protein
MHAELIRRTDCTVAMYTDEFPIIGILGKTRMEAVRLPELEILLGDSLCEPIAYTKTFGEAKHDPVRILQSSNTMATPSPELWTHGAINKLDSSFLVGSTACQIGRVELLQRSRKRVYCASSIFQSTGLVDALREICYNNATVVIGHDQTQTFRADSFSDVLECAGVDRMIYLASTLEDIAENHDVVAKLGTLDHIICVGG